MGQEEGLGAGLHLGAVNLASGQPSRFCHLRVNPSLPQVVPDMSERKPIVRPIVEAKPSAIGQGIGKTELYRNTGEGMGGIIGCHGEALQG